MYNELCLGALSGFRISSSGKWVGLLVGAVVETSLLVGTFVGTGLLFGEVVETLRDGFAVVVFADLVDLQDLEDFEDLPQDMS